MEGMSPGHFSVIHLMLTCQPLNPDDDLTLFIRDALRFISAFIAPISQRAAHVYLSALPFAPEESHVARNFCSRFPNTFVVTEGKPKQWSMVVFTTEHDNSAVFDVAFSPDESTFSSRSKTATCICDSETGRRISGPFRGAPDVCFSPAGKHVLVKYSSYAIVWDVEIGEEQLRIEGSDFAFVHYDGRIVSMKKDGDSDDSGDGNSDDSGDGDSDDSEHKGANRILVQSWDASNGVSNRLLQVDDVRDARFSPDGHFLAIAKKSEDVIELWNLEDSKDFRRFTQSRKQLRYLRYLLFLCFSPDGHFMAIAKESEDVIELWNLEDSKDFRQFTYPHRNLSSIRFSPTSDTLIVGSGGQICLWRLDTQEMASFSYYSWRTLDVIHSPLTNYLFILRNYSAEIWDVSATGSKMIWEIKPASTSGVRSICPSCNGHRVLVGYYDGSVRMWNLDLENLTINQADTTDTRDYSDEQRAIRISPSGKMAVTISRQSSNVGFLDTTTGKVVARTDIKADELDTYIAFSPDEDQVAFMHRSLTICNIMHPEKRVSFWPREDVLFGKVAFQTCNDLVICAVLRDKSGLLQVWHRQDHTGFECTYSLDIGKDPHPFLAPDGLTVVIVPFPSSYPSSAKCYSWNRDTAQFDLVQFDDQVYIRRHPSPQYSPDGKLFACWFDKDSHVRVWDTRTRHLVSKFPTSRVDEISLSPALIDHSLGERLVVLRLQYERVIPLFDAFTGHLRTQILGEVNARMEFLRDGTALANYDYNFIRIWEIADFTAEHQHSSDGFELMMQGMKDGWMMGQDDEPLFWVPVENREGLYVPPFKALIEESQTSITILDFSHSRFGRKWTECIDKGWLRELEQKEREMGNLLE